MEVTRIKIKNFKRIDDVEISLAKVNYLVGGNNSGKSSVLQAIHMAASCAKLSLERKEQVLPESELRYSPTSEFTLLGHSSPYENKAAGSRGRVEFIGNASDGTLASYRIEIYKGRNYGSVGVDRTGTYSGFGQDICDPKNMFSIFVPGIAGIPHREEHKNFASVFLKAAGGEANLVFRNILRILWEKGKLGEVVDILEEIIGPCSIDVSHDAERDLYVDVKFSQGDGKSVPIDLTGTGILQLVQLIAYVSLFVPKFLLVDEPDNHLHASRQVLLGKTFDRLAERYGSTIVVTTHSRHLVSAASSSAKIIWMKEGRVETDECKDLVAILMDIGALDQLDSKGVDCIICTEDKGKKVLQACVEHLGLSDCVKVISYSGIGNATAAVAIKEMTALYDQEPKIIIHRDRDFLVIEELDQWSKDFTNRGMTIFSPPLSDIESYLCLPEHIAKIYGISVESARGIVNEVLAENEEQFRAKFRKKRQDAVSRFWKDGGSPDTAQLWPDGQSVTKEKAYGKLLLSKLNDRFNGLPGGRLPIDRHASSSLSELLKVCLSEVGVTPP